MATSAGLDRPVDSGGDETSTSARRGEGLRGLVARHPLLAIFLIALAVRLFTAAVLIPAFGSSLILDDEGYLNMAVQAATGRTGEWSPFAYALYRATATFLVPITAIYYVVGPVEIAGQVFVALCGSGVVVLVFRLARGMLPWPYVLVPVGIVALLPSQVLWSSALLKDAVVWLLLCAIAALTVRVLNETGLELVVCLGAICVLMFLLGHTRFHTLIIAAWAFGFATLLGRRDELVPRLIGALSILMLVPWAVGLGFAGFDFIANAGSLERYRLAQSRGNSAIIDPDSESDQRERDGSRTPRSPTSADGDGLPADIRHLPRGLSVMLLEPYPWQSGDTPHFNLARVEAVLWYPVLVLAVLGLSQIGRHVRRLAFPLLAGGGSLLVAALTEGNVGTAFRHRGEFVWVIALLAGLGAQQAWIRFADSNRRKRAISG